MPEPDQVNIPVRSEQQAMDWSLVLISQGIPAVIAHSDDPPGWTLRINRGDLGAAVTALRQYHLENRGWSWRSPLPGTGTLFHWGSAFWGLFLGFFYGADAWSGHALRRAGMFDPAAVQAGEWWRFFTAISLHANVAHLAANMTTGFLLLGLAMARYGAGAALVAAFLAGALGNAGGFLLYEYPYQSVGASGMVLGALGLLSMQSLHLRRENPHASRAVLSGILAGLMLLVLLGLDPSSDVIAHIAGFFAGLLLGAGLAAVPFRLLRRPPVNTLLIGLLSAGVAWMWWKALREP